MICSFTHRSSRLPKKIMTKKHNMDIFDAIQCNKSQHMYTISHSSLVYMAVLYGKVIHIKWLICLPIARDKSVATLTWCIVWYCWCKNWIVPSVTSRTSLKISQEEARSKSVSQCLIQDKISTSPSPTERRVVVTPRGRARSSHWAIFLLNNIAITNNSTFPKIKLHYSISYCNKTKSNNLI